MWWSEKGKKVRRMDYLLTWKAKQISVQRRRDNLNPTSGRKVKLFFKFHMEVTELLRACRVLRRT
jgi:hypothetical protein